MEGKVQQEVQEEREAPNHRGDWSSVTWAQCGGLDGDKKILREPKGFLRY